MKGIVLLNAYTKSAGANRQASRIAEELNALGVQTEMRLNGAFDADIFSSRVRLAQKPDFVVYLDKDKYLSRLWEKALQQRRWRGGVRRQNAHLYRPGKRRRGDP